MHVKTLTEARSVCQEAGMERGRTVSLLLAAFTFLALGVFIAFGVAMLRCIVVFTFREGQEGSGISDGRRLNS